MEYAWYKIFSYSEFFYGAPDSMSLTLDLEDIGERTIHVFRGRFVCVLFEETFMPVNFEGQNPFKVSPYAVKLEDDFVWLGVEVEE